MCQTCSTGEFASVIRARKKHNLSAAQNSEEKVFQGTGQLRAGYFF
jgi:hypothetical protein